MQISSYSYVKKWLIVASILGIVSGISALLFFYAILFFQHVFLNDFVGVSVPSPDSQGGVTAFTYTIVHYWLLPVSIVAGGLISGLIVYKFAPEAAGHGTDAAINAFHNKQGKIRRRIPLVKGLASAILIGSGGSGGREGPTAQMSAGIGSWLADTLGMSDNDRRMAVAVCIGAGIGTIFMAPIGGAILAAEILYKRDLETEVIYPAIIASAIGYSIFGSVVGFTPIFGYNLVPFNVLGLPLFALLGIVTGLLAIVYVKSFYFVHKRFASLKISNYAKPVMGAFAVGMIALVFPEVTGVGYGWVQILMNGTLNQIPTFGLPLLIILILLPFAKILATAFSIGSGGSGGVYAPGLMIGAVAGLLLFLPLHALVPSVATITAPFVIIGMLSLFGAAGKAPIAVLIMVVEMTGSLQLLPGAMVAVVIAYFISGDNSIYSSQVESRKDSPVHFGEYNIPLLTKMILGDIKAKDIQINVNADVFAAKRKMEALGMASLPVTSGGKLFGAIYLVDLENIYGNTRIRKMARKGGTYLRPSSTVEEAWEVMGRNKTLWVPIVSGGKYIGAVTMEDILRSYQRELKAFRLHRSPS